MPTINGGVCVVNSKPVDKVYSNGKQVYGRNLWAISKVVNGWLWSDSGLPNPTSAPDGMIPNPFTIPVGEKSLVMTTYNPNKVVNTSSSYRVAFFNGSNFIEPKMGIHLTGEAVQTNKWDIPTEATKVYLSAILAPDGVSVHDPSIRIKYEFGDQATPWTPAPEDVGIAI